MTSSTWDLTLDKDKILFNRKMYISNVRLTYSCSLLSDERPPTLLLQTDLEWYKWQKQKLSHRNLTVTQNLRRCHQTQPPVAVPVILRIVCKHTIYKFVSKVHDLLKEVTYPLKICSFASARLGWFTRHDKILAKNIKL